MITPGSLNGRLKKLERGRQETSLDSDKERVRFFWQVFQGERPLEDYEQLPEGCRERDAVERMIFLLSHGKARELLGLKSHPPSALDGFLEDLKAEGPHLEWPEFQTWWKEEREYALPDLDVAVWRQLEAGADEPTAEPVMVDEATERAELERRIRAMEAKLNG